MAVDFEGLKKKLGKSYNDRRAALNLERECFLDNCSAQTIKSHILQKNGILSKIATNGHLYELNHNRFLTQPLSFKRTGINDILTCKGFCNLHDTMIFKEIEVGDINYNSYRSHLLLSFRAIVNEVRKKQIIIDWWSTSLKEKDLLDDQKSFMQWQLFLQELGIKDMLFYSDSILVELMNPQSEKSFVFHHSELPYYEVLSSSIYAPHLNKSMVESGNIDEWVNTIIPTVFVHTFPYNGKLQFITGCHVNYLNEDHSFITNLQSLNEEAQLKYLSDIFIKRTESWVCSSAFYEANIKHREREILDAFEMFPHFLDPSHELTLNIFNE